MYPPSEEVILLMAGFNWNLIDLFLHYCSEEILFRHISVMLANCMECEKTYYYQWLTVIIILNHCVRVLFWLKPESWWAVYKSCCHKAISLSQEFSHEYDYHYILCVLLYFTIFLYPLLLCWPLKCIYAWTLLHFILNGCVFFSKQFGHF